MSQFYERICYDISNVDINISLFCRSYIIFTKTVDLELDRVLWNGQLIMTKIEHQVEVIAMFSSSHKKSER